MNNTVLQMTGVTKSFGATKALKGIDLDIRQGEVHAIVGSNGAGKSTLMKTLAGEYTPDSGTILLKGEDITGLTPLEIQSRGIEVVHQVLNTVDSMSIMENVLIAGPPSKQGFLNWRSGAAKVKEIFDFIGMDVDVMQPVGSLSVSEKQFVILAKAIIRQPEILVFDEPTARIGFEETKMLFELIRKLKEKGTTMIYISHRMEEIYSICDMISVFRDGTRIDTKPTETFDEDDLIAKMIGQKLETFYPKKDVAIGDTVLEIENLRYKDRVNGFDLKVNRGEIVSLVGAVGAGKTEIVSSVFGTLNPDSGVIKVAGEKLAKGHRPSKAIKNGIALVPEDRKLQGMIGDRSIKNNATSINMSHISSKGMIDQTKENELSQGINDRLLVHPDDINYKMKDLSGGNQQKVVIGKWLLDDYHLYLLDEVAAGVDVGAKFEIYSLIGDLAEKGAGVVLATGDIEEAMGLSDRIVILYKGQVIKEVKPETTTKDEILTYIMGGGTGDR